MTWVGQRVILHVRHIVTVNLRYICHMLFIFNCGKQCVIVNCILIQTENSFIIKKNNIKIISSFINPESNRFKSKSWQYLLYTNHHKTFTDLTKTCAQQFNQLIYTQLTTIPHWLTPSVYYSLSHQIAYI